MRSDAAKTKKLLMIELNDLHSRIAELEASQKVSTKIAAEYKKMEQALRNSEEKFSRAFHSGPAFIAIIAIKDGKHVEVNESYLRATGYTREELIDRTVDEIHIWAKEGDYNRMMGIFREKGRIDKQEFEFRMKSGEIRTWLTSAEPVDISGEPCVVGISIDVTEHNRMEKALHQSEANYASLVEKGNDGIIIIENGVLRFVNTRMAHMTGFTLDEVLGRKFVDFAPPEDRIGLMEQHLKRMAGKKAPQIFEAVIVTRAGQRIPVEINASTTVFKGHTAVMAIVRDITIRKRAEEKLRESEEKFSKAFMSSPEAITIARLSDGMFLDVNTSFMRLTGYTREELIGQSAARLNMWYSAEQYQEFNRSVQNHEKIYDKEQLFYTRTGEVRTWLISNEYISLSGEQCLLTVSIDITELKRAEASLVDEANRWRILMEQSKDGIVILEENGKVHEANRRFAEMIGYSPEEVKDLHVWDWGVKLPQAQIREVLFKVGETGEQFETQHRRKDGTVFDVEISTNSANFGGHKLIFCVCRDITERKQHEARTMEMEALKRINQAKSELLANVSHELRTPLASIKGFIETLIEPDVKWNKRKQLEFLQIANQETDRLTFLIRDLLDMSRIDSGKMILDKHSNSIGDILDSVSGVLSVITAKHKLHVKAVPESPQLFVDKVRIGQVITNLVENAAKFSAEGSPIVIEVKNADKSIIFSVEDKGEGLSQEAVSQLFNRFYQAERVVSGKTRGTGLGLAICKGIVEAHGGKIWVESQSGQGSKFSFSIPL
jgi:PAS domain S-box-containing protein